MTTPGSAVEMHHVGLTVGDLDRSVEFYRDHLGLRELARTRLDGRLISEQTELEGTAIDIAIMASANTVVELLCYASPAPRPHTLRACDVGAAHICIAVADIEATVAAMEDRGVVFHSRPSRLMGDETTMIYVRDPDGIIVELIQPSAALELSTLLGLADAPADS